MIDHTRSRVAAIQSNGLWQVLPGDSAIKARLIDAVYREAEQQFWATELSEDQRRQAREQTVAIVAVFAIRLGWTIEVVWPTPDSH